MINRLFGGGVVFSALLSFCTLAEPLPMQSVWVKDSAGNVIEDPQTSALVYWRERFLSIGDGSSQSAMRLQLLPIDPATAKLADETIALVQSDAVKNGCFSRYLAYKPDLEAVAIYPDNDKVFVIATEDAHHYSLKGDCLKKYGNTGSTEYPTLLLRAELVADDKALITHAKPVHFPKEYNVGNSPNDGIEGLVFGAGRTLYLGLEKDAKGRARVFELNIDNDFWARDGMAVVKDSELLVPVINDGENHPINALAYYPSNENEGFLFAAARNDNQVWILDTAKKKPTEIVDMSFLAESLNEACPNWQIMDNYSIEGMTFIGDRLYLINDPWKTNYKKNAQCKPMLKYYKAMAPLLTSVEVRPEWIERK